MYNKYRHKQKLPRPSELKHRDKEQLEKHAEVKA